MATHLLLVFQKRAAGWRLIRWLKEVFGRFATRRRLGILVAVGVLMALAFQVRNAWVLRDATDHFKDNALSLPDGHFPPYGPETLIDVLGELDVTGARVYAISEVTLDFLFPLLYGLLLGASLVALSRRQGHRLAFSLLLPPLAALGDWVENVCYALLAWPGGAIVGSRSVAWMGVLGGWTKWLALLASLVAVVVVGRELWTRWLQHLAVIRVPLLALGGYLFLVWNPMELPALANMVTTWDGLGLGIAAFTVVLFLAVIGFCAVLAWRLAPKRFKLEPIRICPQWFQSRPVWSIVPFLLPAGLMFVRLWKGAAITILVVRIGALLAGVGLAVGLLIVLTKARRMGILSGIGAQLLPLLRILGPGYTRKVGGGREELLPGHALMIGVGAILILLYGLGYWRLNPLYAPLSIPTIAYVLFLLALLCLLLTGISFFLDRYRFPLLLAVLLFLVVSGKLFPRDHYFTVWRNGEAAPTIEKVIDQRPDIRILRQDGQEPQRLVTVISASGGGILAAGWTSQVLTGLQEALGPEFTDSIHLISAISGGSVGTFFFLEGFEDFAPPSAERLLQIREAAMATSLEASAWGLVFPDFLRLFVPFVVPENHDRALALERAWLQNLHCMEHGENQDRCQLRPSSLDAASSLGKWRRKASEGRMPGVIFGGTVVEEGVPFLMSNLDVGSFACASKKSCGASASPSSSVPPAFRTVEELAEGQGSIDMAAVTAARLSATFPYVTPVARARFKADSETDIAPWHIGDGGYYDWHGSVAALQWIDRAVKYLKETEGENFKILFIQIKASLPEEEAKSAETWGWAGSTLAPVKAVAKVRRAAQRALIEPELEERKDRLGDQLETVIFWLPVSQWQDDAGKEDLDPPLSWELSIDQKKRIRESWTDESNNTEVENLRSRLFGERPASREADQPALSSSGRQAPARIPPPLALSVQNPPER
jgi:hypothetical protein